VSAQSLNPESSPTFITIEEAYKAAYENGFRVELGRNGGWVGYRSTTARGEVWIARDPVQNNWLLAITHPGVVSEISFSRAEIAITGQSLPILNVCSQGPNSRTLLPPARTRSRAHTDDPC
jgi:hypothetical protein